MNSILMMTVLTCMLSAISVFGSPQVNKAIDELYLFYEELKQVDDISVTYLMISRRPYHTVDEARIYLGHEFKEIWESFFSNGEDLQELREEYILRSLPDFMQESENESFWELYTKNGTFVIQQYDGSHENLMVEHEISKERITTRDRIEVVLRSDPTLERVSTSQYNRSPWESSVAHRWVSFIRLSESYEFAVDITGDQSVVLYLSSPTDTNEFKWEYKLRLQEIKGRFRPVEFTVKTGRIIRQSLYQEYVEIQPGVWFPSVVHSVPVKASEDDPVPLGRSRHLTYLLDF